MHNWFRSSCTWRWTVIAFLLALLALGRLERGPRSPAPTRRIPTAPSGEEFAAGFPRGNRGRPTPAMTRRAADETAIQPFDALSRLLDSEPRREEPAPLAR